MDSTTIAIVLSSLASVLAILALIKVSRVPDLNDLIKSECARQEDSCQSNCDHLAQQALNTLQITRNTEHLEHMQRLVECNVLVDNNAKQQCRDEEEARYAPILAAFEAQVQRTETERDNCYSRCATLRRECDRSKLLRDALDRRKLIDEFDEVDKPQQPPMGPGG